MADERGHVAKKGLLVWPAGPAFPPRAVVLTPTSRSDPARAGLLCVAVAVLAPACEGDAMSDERGDDGSPGPGAGRRAPHEGAHFARGLLRTSSRSVCGSRAESLSRWLNEGTRLSRGEHIQWLASALLSSDRPLAAEIAALAGETLPDAPHSPASPLRPGDASAPAAEATASLAAVVCAAAEALDVSPRGMRRAPPSPRSCARAKRGSPLEERSSGSSPRRGRTRRREPRAGGGCVLALTWVQSEDPPRSEPNDLPFSYEYPRPSVTADTVLFAMRAEDLAVLLVKRKNPPHRGAWALPGGFVNENESLDRAAARELMEETGITGIPLEQLGAFGDPGRDPRGHTITVAFYSFVVADAQPVAADDAADAGWHPLRSLPLPSWGARSPEKSAIKLAFDHARIIDAARRRLQERLVDPTRQSPFEIVPARFTLTELRRVYEAVLGRTIGAASFRARVVGRGIVEPVTPARGKKRASNLFRFKRERRA